MAIQTSFAKKVTWFQDGNHRYLAGCKKPRPRPLPVRKQLDPSDILISFFPRPPWREIFWDRTRPYFSSSQRLPFFFSQGLPFPPTKAGRGRGIITIPRAKARTIW